MVDLLDLQETLLCMSILNHFISPDCQKQARRDVLGVMSKCASGQEIHGYIMMWKRRQMLVLGILGTGSWGNHCLSVNGIEALERNRLPVPTSVSEHHSSHVALALAVKKPLSIISYLSSSLLLHYPFLKTVCNHFRMINKVTLQGRKLCITLFLSLGKSLLWLKCFNSSLSCIASTCIEWASGIHKNINISLLMAAALLQGYCSHIILHVLKSWAVRSVRTENAQRQIQNGCGWKNASMTRQWAGARNSLALGESLNICRWFFSAWFL